MLRSLPTVAESNNNEVIGCIASAVKTLRDDVASMRSKMVTRGGFDVAITAVRGDIEQVQLRFDSMEHSISSRFEQVEGEISRLRSAVCLPGKDRPDVLRMLGQTSS